MAESTRDPRDQAATERVTLGDAEIERGSGGETHQLAGERSQLTTQQGVVVGDDQNTLRPGARGPALLEDFHFREKLFHFDHERIPERVVHARGFGVHGYFENYESLADLTAADLFQRPGERTSLFVRFSTVAGNKGSSDLARDVRGFAVKFYTKAGNWDLVGNNIPIFFIQDAIKFPDFVHAAKQEPDRGFPQAQTAHDNFWDFVSLSPESTAMLLWIMSDRAIPRSFRFMEGFGIHTFRFVNAAGQSHFVKFHWKPKQGLQSVMWNEALKISGADPDFHRRDMWDAIGSGDFPEWELCVQVFDDDFADRFEFDVLDPTKIIPEEQLPVRPIGRMVLDRRVDNFFAETEQVAFCTQNIVPGIDFSDDPLLQGRNFSYLDTQLKRLGSPNFTHLPINAPKTAVANFQQDGHMAMRNPTTRANYEPNSWPVEEGGPREDPASGFTTYPAEVGGGKRRLRADSFADHYSQARQFFISQTPNEQLHIINAFVFELSKCDRADIRTRMVAGLCNVHDDLAAGVAAGLGMTSLPPAAPAARPTRTDLPASDALSIVKNGPSSPAGRKLGVLVTDGVDGKLLEDVRGAAQGAGALVEIVAPTVQGISTRSGEPVEVDQKLDGAPSVLYDAVVLLPGTEKVATLAKLPVARDFVEDAFAHCKFIAHNADATTMFSATGLADKVDDGFFALDGAGSVSEFLESLTALRFWAREAQFALREVPMA